MPDAVAQGLPTMLQRLVQPHPSVHDPATRQAAALTATLCIIALPLAAVTLAIAPRLADPSTPYFESVLVKAGTIAIVLVVAAYGLARSSWPKAGIHLLPWGVFAASWFLILTGEGSGWEAAADFLVVGAAIASLTLPFWASSFAWLANFVAFAAFLAVRAKAATTFEIEDRAVTLILLGALPPLLIVGQIVRDRLQGMDPPAPMPPRP